MPQITVEYSADLAGGFDRERFALAFHHAGSELLGSALGDFKTRFHRLDEVVIGDGAPGHGMVHIALEILPGRPAELRHRLGELARDLARDHLEVNEGQHVQVTVEVRDLHDYYKVVL
ncbi:5-carboxymethyl-2-hydroxymuconate Delta-isomerase [Spirillospora sp. CA-253888]